MFLSQNLLSFSRCMLILASTTALCSCSSEKPCQKPDTDTPVVEQASPKDKSPKKAHSFTEREKNRAREYNSGIRDYNHSLYDEAIAHYKSALKIDPRYALAYTGLGDAYLKKGEMRKALEHFNKSIKLNPKPQGTFYMSRGQVYCHLEEWGKAKQDFKKVIELMPEQKPAFEPVIKKLEEAHR